MEKRLIMAVALSLVVLLMFQRFMSPKKSEIPIMTTETPQTDRGTAIENGESNRTMDTEQTARKQAQTEEKVPEKTFQIETDKYRLCFSDIGGNLKKIELKEYQTKDTDELLYEALEKEEQIFAIKSELIKTANQKKYTYRQEAGFVTFTLTEPGWLEIVKRYKIQNSADHIELELFVKNLSSRTVFFPYRINGPAHLEKTDQITGRSFLEADTLIDGKVWKVKSLKEPKETSGQVSWTGLKNRYFALVLRAFDFAESATVKTEGQQNLGITLKIQGQDIAPGQTLKNRFLLYAGPLNEKRIAETGHEDMTRIVDYGFFGKLSNILLAILRFFHQIGIKNWGVAIICLTILVNVILFPLTYKSFSSMQKIKQIQPHIQKLKELHKDNPNKMNKEMMELYRKYKVNPLGGCLPMILQMPIFIALYQGLMRSIELKGAQFLWIKNLAKPDAVHLPFSLPFIGNQLNILPLLMAGMMIVQQKASQGTATVSAEQAQQQKMMMLLMPVLFGFLFYNMPSGLVLYWLTNTILMTSEQKFINKRIAEK
ncbi:MAG: membrane protein insertase YidC [Candidatus Omnitrophica bacterium]|nr:membrane protein insertase YidC [Candidatus Omnitrophota bacterium]